MTKASPLEGTKQLMAALGRMPPKAHEDMKLGKRRKKIKRPNRGASAKRKTA